MDKTKWAYGVTTVPSRKADLLPRTLESLAAGGFDRPRLFVDGTSSGYESFGLEVTYRQPRLLAYGNWILGLAELFIREPTMTHYAMFQDDVIVVPQLRDYLRKWYPDKGYLNLYTYPRNASLAAGVLAGKDGWFESNQKGKGALGLVFSRDAVVILLTHQHIVERPRTPDRGTMNIDGGVVSAFTKAGWKEWCHLPSLAQHTGLASTLGHPPVTSPAWKDGWRIE